MRKTKFANVVTMRWTREHAENGRFGLSTTRQYHNLMRHMGDCLAAGGHVTLETRHATEDDMRSCLMAKPRFFHPTRRTKSKNMKTMTRAELQQIDGCPWEYADCILEWKD